MTTGSYCHWDYGRCPNLPIKAKAVCGNCQNTQHVACFCEQHAETWMHNRQCMFCGCTLEKLKKSYPVTETCVWSDCYGGVPCESARSTDRVYCGNCHREIVEWYCDTHLGRWIGYYPKCAHCGCPWERRKNLTGR